MKPAWYEEAKTLQREGLSIRQISERIDVPRSTVGSHLHAPNVCPTCGGERGNDAHRLGHYQCRVCENAERTEGTRERAEQIAAWWADGERYGQIAARLGWSTGRLSFELDRIRRHWPEVLPHRRTPEQRERMRTARWEKAA